MSKDSAQEQQLKAIREEIDQIDRQIQTLINQRADCAKRVAEVKTQGNDKEAAVFYRPEREAQVLREVMRRNTGPVSNEEMARIFREVMAVCLALEQPLRVAFLGPKGTFTQAAALKHFGHSVESIPLASIDEVFREVESGNVHYGVVPVENSTEGRVNSTLDSFMRSALKICGEVELRIHHHLLTKEAIDLKSVTVIYSHEQSLAQCRRWLNTHLPNAQLVSVGSNADAARRVLEARADQVSAAIAGDMAAEIYQLHKQASNIEDEPDNSTRFLILGKQNVAPSGQDKTSVIIAMRNKPGALYLVLKPFQEAGVMLTRVETRPSRSGNWTYVFFVDFEGHWQDAKVKKVFEEIAAEAADLKLLGSYPVAVL